MVQLATHLAQSYYDKPLPPLEAETVVVQSNELTRWLSLFLAHQHGIVSHIDFPYPSAYIWALFHQLLPNTPQESTFSTQVMAWRLFELLPECCQQSGFDPIKSYLGEEDDPLKRYALAHRIADTFDQYLMYRPDWIEQWEQGDTPHWQARLWQRLTVQKGDARHQTQHRAHLLTQLKQYLASCEQRPDTLPERIAIFGISALPPVYLELFSLMAKHCDITVYFLSPSAEYWGDITDKETTTQTDIDYFNSGHSLLASLGKQGQEFFQQLQDYQPEETFLFSPPENTRLLGTLQDDIYSLNEVTNAPQKHLIDHDDDSMMIHACHSAMREIEVLHDQLLALFERHPDLSPSDVVVMTPDVQIYTPWIEAVFGCVPKGNTHFIPYGIADEGMQQQSALLTAFTRLLGLPQSRFDVDMVMGLLECPAIQAAFSLDNVHCDRIRTWLRDTNTRWGFSAEDKVALDLPSNEYNTWRAGLDRLLMGYALPLSTDGAEDWQDFDGTLGFDGIHGERAETMAQLCRFMDKLDQFRQRLKASFTAEEWQRHLGLLLDTFFKASKEDENDDATLLAIRTALSSLVDSTCLAGFKQKIKCDLVADYLAENIKPTAQQTRFMGKGITFCGMVPMRSIPFPVVCLIGMNDDSYPRRQPVAGFDLLSQPHHFRKGDRSRRDDDRYLFLESLLSAQSHLYISYVGASCVDNADIPPSVLVSDLRDSVNQGFTLANDEEGDTEVWQQILTKHPLQAFSRRYFDGHDPKLFSYATTQCPQTQQPTEGDFNQPINGVADEWKLLTIDQLIYFFRHPAKYFLQQRLGLYLDNDKVSLESREPFSLEGLKAWKLRQHLLHAQLNECNIERTKDLIQASGNLPHYEMGDSVFNKQNEKVTEFIEQLKPDYPDAFLTPQSIDLRFGEFSLSGQLSGIAATGLFDYKMSKVKGHHLLETWIKHLVLNCIKPKDCEYESLLITEDKHYHFKPVEDAQTLLTQLIELYWQGLERAIPFFSNTSFAIAKATLNNGTANPETAMNTAWQGSLFQAGEKDDLYHQQLYVTSPFGDEFEKLALSVYEPVKAHLLSDKL